MTHEEHNIGGGAEHPGSDEQKVSLMLSGLKRVEAPKDFDFHLKARIAKGRPEEIRPASLFPILKYAVPLALVLFVSAGILLRSSYNSWETPTVAEANTSSQPSLPTNVAGPSDPAVIVPQPSVVASDKGRTSIVGTDDAATGSKTLADGGSRDFIRQPEVPLGQPGGNSAVKAITAPTPRNPRGMEQKKYTAREGLEFLGIEADFENGNWMVKSLKPNMAGDQVGVKAGDRVIALDGKPIDDKTEFDGGVSVTTIRVSRDGKTLDLDSKSKPK